MTTRERARRIYSKKGPDPSDRPIMDQYREMETLRLATEKFLDRLRKHHDVDEVWGSTYDIKSQK